MKKTYKILFLFFGGIFVLALFSFTKNQLALGGTAGKIGKAAAVKAGTSVLLLSDGMSSFVYNTDGSLFKAISAPNNERRYTQSKDHNNVHYTASLYSNGV